MRGKLRMLPKTKIPIILHGLDCAFELYKGRLSRSSFLTFSREYATVIERGACVRTRGVQN